MNLEDNLSDSFDIDSTISRVTPKRTDQSAQSSIKNRFTILSDMIETSNNRKGEEKFVLTKYLQDLHDEQKQENTKPTQDRTHQTPTNIQANFKKQSKEGSHNQSNWKRKQSHQTAQTTEQRVSHLSSQNLKKSTIRNGGNFGIFIYKKKIDLNQPIDFEVEEKQNIHRNYGQSRNSAKTSAKQRRADDDCFSFGEALFKQKHSKYAKYC